MKYPLTENCCVFTDRRACPYKADYVFQSPIGLDFCLCSEHAKKHEQQGRTLIPFSVYAEEQERERIRLVRKETKRVEYHKIMAEKYALSSTLTVAQWLKTLDHFSWRCAYCHRGSYAVLEHFVPLIHGGGTTAYNCLPACNSCNAIKSDAHPQVFEDKFPQDRMKYLKFYLLQQRESEVSA